MTFQHRSTSQKTNSQKWWVVLYPVFKKACVDLLENPESWQTDRDCSTETVRQCLCVSFDPPVCVLVKVKLCATHGLLYFKSVSKERVKNRLPKSCSDLEIYPFDRIQLLSPWCLTLISFSFNYWNTYFNCFFHSLFCHCQRLIGIASCQTHSQLGLNSTRIFVTSCVRDYYKRISMCS